MKILYLINVPYGWIKQRPHFFAEYLSKDHDVTVFQQRYLHNPFKKSTQVHDEEMVSNSFRIFDYYKKKKKRFIPNIFVTILNKTIISVLSRKVKGKYDIIWFSSPMVYKRLKFLVSNAKYIVYDCMDDYLEFPETKNDSLRKELIFSEEKELLNKASLTIFSADYLRKKVFARYNISHPYVIVNNAIEIPQIEDINISSKICNDIKKFEKNFIYIGTISEWFDFKTILEVLNKCEDINFVLIGPRTVTIPAHPRLHYYGPVEHNRIFPIMSLAYALVMPFLVNELIRSVNPVKLYEYIYSGKPVIAVRYEETEKFEDFVYLYNNSSDFIHIIKTIENVKPTDIYLGNCRNFVTSNTWQSRCKIINEALINLKL